MPCILQPFNPVFVGIPVEDEVVDVVREVNVVVVGRAMVVGRSGRSRSAKAAAAAFVEELADEVDVGRRLLVIVPTSRTCSDRGDERVHGKEASNARTKVLGRKNIVGGGSLEAAGID